MAKIELTEQIVAHFLGCEIIDTQDRRQYTFKGIESMFGVPHLTTHQGAGIPLHLVKLRLRPIADMSEQEFETVFPDSTKELEEFKHLYSKGYRYSFTPLQTVELMHRGFDVLDLIQGGAAVPVYNYFKEEGL